jgi:acetoin utilization deacetylase AcuC-like enzyme
MPVLVTYHEDFSAYGYPYLKYRIKPAFQALQSLIQDGLIEVLQPEVTPEISQLAEDLHHVLHIKDVKDSGYYAISLLSLAGVVQTAEQLAAGKYQSGFAFVGAAGHHASPFGFWGFCFLNDVAAAIKHLRQLGKQRFLILDVDPHFGDGTRKFFKQDAKVVHLNLYTGNKDDLDTKLHNYDFGLSYNAGDAEFAGVIDRALAPAFEFDLMFVVFGHDSHAADYGGFALSDQAYPSLARRIKDFARGRPVLWVLSGGAKTDVACQAIPQIIRELAK